MKKRIVLCNICLLFLVAVMVLPAGIKETLAYFTTYVRAEGGYIIQSGDETEIEEKFYDWTKEITISSKSGSQPMYVRVKAFCGDEYKLLYSDPDGMWTQGQDGYWYYKDILNGGEKTKPLLIKIEGVPEEVKESAEFNVVVIYESTPVSYDQNGNPYADWSAKTEGGR